jgi:hypothetical protein
MVSLPLLAGNLLPPRVLSSAFKRENALESLPMDNARDSCEAEDRMADVVSCTKDQVEEPVLPVASV